MKYEPLVPTPGQKIMNTEGDIAVTTLWSPVDSIEYHPRIAVVGTLYGAGIHTLVRNLAYNPQITRLYYTGVDLGNSVEKLKKYVKNIPLGALPHPIIFPAAIPNERDREVIPAPVPSQALPSSVFNHTISADEPAQVWRTLLKRMLMFGQLVTLKKGQRRELLNVKALIHQPTTVDTQYVRSMFNPHIPTHQPYSYGNRINKYFGKSFLKEAYRILTNDQQSRKAYFTLWDNKQDHGSNKRPCLVALFFRILNNQLTMTVTFRTQNLLDAWLPNAHAMAAIQKDVADALAIPVGPLTVISHSLTLDPANDGEERARKAARGQRKFQPDPNGYFTIRRELPYIVAEHWKDDVLLGVYRGRNPGQVLRQIEPLISSVEHALWVGKEVAECDY